MWRFSNTSFMQLPFGRGHCINSTAGFFISEAFKRCKGNDGNESPCHSMVPNGRGIDVFRCRSCQVDRSVSKLACELAAL